MSNSPCYSRCGLAATPRGIGQRGTWAAAPGPSGPGNCSSCYCAMMIFESCQWDTLAKLEGSGQMPRFRFTVTGTAAGRLRVSLNGSHGVNA